MVAEDSASVKAIQVKLDEKSRAAYSARRARVGSTLVARRAGIWQARGAPAGERRPTKAKVRASVSLTPKSRDLRKRVKASESAVPTTRPDSVNRRPWRRTRR